MSNRTSVEIFPPGEFIREELEERGWTQGDLADILGRPLNRINEIISGKRSVTPETAKGLADAFGTSPELWLNLENAFQLSRIKKSDESVTRRAKLYEKAPVKEMIRRGWIESSTNIEVLESRVMDFLEIKTLDQEIRFWAFAARTSLAYKKPTPSQLAWLYRARHLSKAVTANKFNEANFKLAIFKLQQLLHAPQEIRLVPQILAECGIRFLTVEAIPKTRIDGACFWLNPHSPVIVLSLRYDRIDSFWHTLFHELGHIKNRDGLNNSYETLDTDLIGKDAAALADKPPAEKAADKFAVGNLIPQDKLENFITRVSPLYSKINITRFANNNNIHPGIAVGQLQHRKEILWSQNRPLLVKIKEIITSAALTDGWGTVPSGL
ncbi:MAG: HigA family addiction module antitoxin [Nitrospirae bacterium]|nr:HigA family addiction module antitoxin [Nitrospirota bacterium]